MFFKKQKKDNIPTATPARISSFITKKSKFEGNITTNDNIEIGGDFIGNIDCEREVIITEFGTVTGNIKADSIINNGKITGDVICNTFKGDKKSFTKEKIKAINISILGVFEGVIECDTLNILEGGFIKKTIQAKNIETAGKIEGDIACETLSTTMHAKIKGKLFVNKLLNNGGTIDGYIGKYQNILTQNLEIAQQNKKIETTENKAVKKKELIAS